MAWIMRSSCFSPRDRSELLVYEPSGDRPLIKDQKGSMNPDQSEAYYTDRLHALSGDEIEIIDVMMTDHRGNRKDPVLCIDTSSFQMDGL